MKYEFIKNGVDDYILKYKDKVINFKSTVGIVSKLQGVEKKARLRMLRDLAETGITIEELKKEIKKDGKTYIDNSNKEEMEKIYIEEEKTLAFKEIMEEMFNMSLEELVFDIGLEEKEIEKFGEEVGNIIAGRFQRQQ